MITCGDLDGKPCEMLGSGCPAFKAQDNATYPACAPVLALLEARKEAARMRQWGIANGRNYMEACTALAEARAEAAKWKRAAERMYAEAEDCPPDRRSHLSCQPGEPHKCAACWAEWSISTRPSTKEFVESLKEVP
jgi:hypothetical protein